MATVKTHFHQLDSELHGEVARLKEMLRITVTNGSPPITLKLEGRLVGVWVDELERAWRGSGETPPSGPVRVDLAGVTYIDSEGKKLLERMSRQGVELRAGNLITKYILDEIRSGRSVSS